MTRTYYRLVLTVLCALAAYCVPVPTLRYPYDLGYFAGGLGASLLAWAFLAVVLALEPEVNPGLQVILGTGAAVISWGRISFVATFEIIPLVVRLGHLNHPFDPIWILGGASPLVIPVVAAWIAYTAGKPLGQGMASALWRFSVPLGLLILVPRWLRLPEQFLWLFLFTGVMFLVLDGLGTGGDWPLVIPRRSSHR